MEKKFGFGGLMDKARQMQEGIGKAQSELSAMNIEGSAGMGLVKVVVSGRYYVKKVTIEDSALQESKETIEDLVAAAFNDAVSNVEKASKGKMAGLMSGLDLPSDLLTTE